MIEIIFNLTMVARLMTLSSSIYADVSLRFIQEQDNFEVSSEYSH